MPKIFLIKDRLHQQQLKLLEAQKQRVDPVEESFASPVSPLSPDQPLSLIIPKNPGEFLPRFFYSSAEELFQELPT